MGAPRVRPRGRGGRRGVPARLRPPDLPVAERDPAPRERAPAGGAGGQRDAGHAGDAPGAGGGRRGARGERAVLLAGAEAEGGGAVGAAPVPARRPRLRAVHGQPRGRGAVPRGVHVAGPGGALPADAGGRPQTAMSAAGVRARCAIEVNACVALLASLARRTVITCCLVICSHPHATAGGSGLVWLMWDNPRPVAAEVGYMNETSIEDEKNVDDQMVKSLGAKKCPLKVHGDDTIFKAHRGVKSAAAHPVISSRQCTCWSQLAALGLCGSCRTTKTAPSGC